MPDPGPEPYLAFCGLDIPPERQAEILAAFRPILDEIRKLRELDLTDEHPAVVFRPTAAEEVRS